MGKIIRSITNALKSPWWVAIVFGMLALSFVFNFWDGGRKVKDNALIDEEIIEVKTVRTPRFEPVAEMMGVMLECNICHQSMPAPEKSSRHFVEIHPIAELNHGHNDLCLNCHHPKNRNAFVAYDGSEIPFQQSDLLCHKCHGPKHRDWEAGVHGRTNGYWDTSRGPLEKVHCIACHDPHDPEFKPFKPAPGPIRDNYHFQSSIEPGKDNHG